MNTVLTARIPGSKSITNRALLLAAAADGVSLLRAPLVSEDTVAFREALAGLGVHVDTGAGAGAGSAAGEGEVWKVTGAGRPPVGPGTVWCEDAGTAARFLPPFAAAGRGGFTFDGTDQLRARPLRPLAEALGRLGARARVTEPVGGLPLTVDAEGLAGGELTVDASLSSQYLTGLLMAGPLMRRPLTVRGEGLVSRPYITMTQELMRHFGAYVDEFDGAVQVLPGGYAAAELDIEPDASTASYFFAAAAVTGTTVTVPGLGRSSVQGDLGFVEVLRRAGAHVEIGDRQTTVTGTTSAGGPLRGGFAVDMGDISDTFMTLAAIAPLADAPVTVHGIGHARLKESDRIAAVEENLRALGIRTESGPDRITVHPGRPTAARIACRRDHRIAMAFSVLGLRVPGITLDDPSCVGKTFPGFHAELGRLFPAHSSSNSH
ncbi:3-phosphoshikimate 1-carboxyvinyltransferase [Streptomyces sp. NPDC046876]|uniref:3-phosphoshikimate 1-carboxyvinyltransferase n=1 Tax=Streptomyces sp. NPDC046876 TaxID=3155616 RepID=UPI0033E21E86